MCFEEIIIFILICIISTFGVNVLSVKRLLRFKIKNYKTFKKEIKSQI